jgi:hypothetical protein
MSVPSIFAAIRRSIAAAVAIAADLMPPKDRGTAQHGDKRAVMILGDNTGAVVRLTVTAIDAGDAVEYGRGVYLAIEGDFGADLRGALANAVLAGDKDICIFLNEPAKANLLEQLETHRTIVAMHQAMAEQNRKRG